MSTRSFRMLLVGLLVMSRGFSQPVTKQGPKATGKQEIPAVKSEDHSGDGLEHVKFPYRPNLERDPFSSPSDNVDKTRAESVDEIGVKGRVVVNGKALAIVIDSRGKTRTLPVGYKFKDGEISAITDRAVVFRQWDPNSTNRSHSKSIEKPFKREEGNR